MARKGGFKIPGLSFSWKRALGISAAKSKISRATGVPLTKGARQRKIGAATGCAIPVLILLTASSGFLWLAAHAIA